MGATGRLLLIVLTFASFVGFDSAFAQSWVMTSAPITNWVSVAMSADGSKVVAAGRGPYASGNYAGPIYISNDSGSNWVQTAAPITNWTSVAISADGTKLAACAGNGWESALYVSTNSGSSWLDRTPISTWGKINLLAVACSADAATLVAVSGLRASYFASSQSFVSTNTGETWTESGLPTPVVASTVACSADGTKIIAGGTGNFYGSAIISTNSGITWMSHDFFGYWVSAACTASGINATLAIGDVSSGPVFVSTDTGEHWEQITNSTAVGRGGDIAVSADGTRGVLVVDGNQGGPIFTSDDSCSTWKETDAPATNWMSAASSADGSRLAAVAGYPWSYGEGGIYTWQTTPRPKLNISPWGGGLLVSWIVPSMPFVLQENADLNTTDWVDVPTQPTLNLSNLHHEVSMPLSATNRFYRLKSL